jgi:hypothetical protein
MAKKRDFGYNSLMRFLALFGILCYLIVAFLPSSGSSGVLAQDVVPKTWTEAAARAHSGDVRFLFHLIELARVRGDPGACASLSPIPLSEGSPSLHDWQAYCEARATSSDQRCRDLAARMNPDLQTLCLEEFSPVAS